MQRFVMILAAGKGTRMKSALPKVLHEAAFHPLLQYVIEGAQEVKAQKIITVIGHGAEAVKEAFAQQTEFVLQQEQKGTGHAVKEGLTSLTDCCGTLLVLCGDTPLLRGETLGAFVSCHEANGAVCSVMTANLENPFGYGRAIRNEDGSLAKIVEQKDANEAEKAVKEINSGVYCFDLDFLRYAIENIKDDNSQGEFYLTDTVAIANAEGKKVLAWVVEDFEEVKGINDRKQLAEASKILFRRKNDALMEAGVTIVSPETTCIDKDVTVGQDTVIEAFCTLRGTTKIGECCEIGPSSEVRNTEIGDGTRFWQSVADQASLGNQCNIGPFAYLRPGTHLADRVKVGDFVEVKNCNIGEGTKVPHLTYLGDSDIGSGCNIACGTITCNYDGYHKYRTTIGDHSFVGCNASLVSPVNIGSDTYIGAGSVITEDIPDGALAVGRSRQKNIKEWAIKFREKHRK